MFIRVFVIVPFPMSMFCKFRHREKSNVFIVIRSVGIVGAREWFMRFYWCCHFGFIVCRVGDYWICGFCMVFVMVGFHYVSIL